MNQIILPEQLYNPLTEENKLVTIHSPHIVDHVLKILKSKAGDSLKVAFRNGPRYLARIREIDKHSLQVELLSLLESSLLKRPSIHAYIGLCRPPSIKKIIEHGATMGINALSFYQTQLSEKSFLQSHVLNHESISQLIDLGLSQSNTYTSPPQTAIYPQLNFLNPPNPSLPLKKILKILLEQSSTQTLLDIISKTDPQQLNSQNNFFFQAKQNFLDYDEVHFALGSERGLVKNEIEYFEKNQFIPIKLAISTLRVEYAFLTFLGQLELFYL